MVNASEIHNEGGFPASQKPKSHLDSHPPLGFLFVSIFHSVNGA
jgi:hypothetical protein